MYLLDTNILSELVRRLPDPLVESRFESEPERLAGVNKPGENMTISLTGTFTDNSENCEGKHTQDETEPENRPPNAAPVGAPNPQYGLGLHRDFLHAD